MINNPFIFCNNKCQSKIKFELVYCIDFRKYILMIEHHNKSLLTIYRHYSTVNFHCMYVTHKVITIIVITIHIHIISIISYDVNSIISILTFTYFSYLNLSSPYYIYNKLY